MNSRVIKMKILVIAAVIAAVSDAFSVLDVAVDEWNLYKRTARRHFRSMDEEFSRMQTFLRRKDLVARHNLRFEQGLESYKTEINKFADRQPFENATNHYMKEIVESRRRYGGKYIKVPPKVKLPDSVDWNKAGAVTEIIDQESCGACYAIAAAEVMESRMFFKNKILQRLSPQQIVDCSESYGNYGCDGGTFRGTFNYLMDNKLVGYDSLPYDNLAHDKCEVKGTPLSDKVTSYYIIRDGDEEKLKYAVATYGPVAAGINALVATFQLYSSGVYSDPTCNSTLNHAVVVTGYGTDPVTKKDYWIVKNSWGDDWGEQGYVQIARNEGNMCGIGTFVYIPLIN